MTASRRDDVAGKAVLLLFMLFTAMPLVSMVSTALQPQGSIPTGINWPTDPQWHNFVDAFNAANLTALLRSSLLIVAAVVPASLIIATMAGYGLAVLRIPGHRFLFVLLLLGLTIPFESLVIPLYYQMMDFGLLNSRLAIALPLIGLFMPFSVFWMRTHFLSVPADLTEAARVDGASSWRALIGVHVPLAVPALSSLAVLLFLWTWNQFLLAIVLVDDPGKRTMAGALGAFQGRYGTDIVLLCAGSLLIMAPTLAVFFVFQRQFVKALLQGSVKG